jgi:hypothetical protein
VEISVDDYVSGRGESGRSARRIRLKLADKLAALNLLARYVGFSEPDRNGKVSEDAAARAIERINTRVERLAPTVH